jgi:hypothetical protein
MEIDWNLVRARFAALTTEELLEEAALRLDDYAPPVQRALQEEALARGITAAQIDERRSAGEQLFVPAPQADGIDLPALITSADDKSHVRDLALLLREQGIPAVVRELDPKHFHASGHRVGHWGLMVSGAQAAEAVAFLESTLPSPEEEAAGCGGGCGGCGPGGGECGPTGEEWPEDGDWWKTAPGEGDPPL